MTPTARQLNRATLARQLLLARQPLRVPEALRHVVALQAQEPASPYLALWNRLAGFDPAQLHAAFTDGTVVKASLMRNTLHAVTAADWPAFHRALAPALRASRLNDRRFAGTGLSAAQADAAVAHVLGYATEPRSNAEMAAMLTERVGPVPEPGLWWALRAYAPLHHAPTTKPWTFGPRPAYTAAPAHRLPEPDAAVQALVRRYLEGFGPATVADIAQFTGLARGAARGALAALDVRRLDGTELYDVPGGPLPDGDTAAPPRLMAMWDSVLLGYADRSRVIPPEYRPLVIRSNGDVLPTLLVDGHVAGVWRPVEGGIEATAFRPLSTPDWQGLGAEAAALVAFLADRDPAVYRRYGRWWAAGLPAAEIRVLAG